MLYPAKFIRLFSVKVACESVVRDNPIISTAWSSNLCFLIKSSLAKMQAADPSEVGQHYNLVKGPCMAGDFLIYSRV